MTIESNKKRDILMESIFRDFPECRVDSLKRYAVEKMVETYLGDPDTFNKKATELMKKDKKNKEVIEPKKLPEEIVCIEKVDADLHPDPQDLQVDRGGFIKVSS